MSSNGNVYRISMNFVDSKTKAVSSRLVLSDQYSTYEDAEKYIQGSLTPGAYERIGNHHYGYISERLTVDLEIIKD